jgi:type IV pilus assembly protein PilV
MKKLSGFTLIEVLISMVLLVTGLLGLAAMQAATLKNNQSAYYRSLATQYAYDMADRMRANRIEAAKMDDGDYIKIDPDDAAADDDCTDTTGCTPKEMASQDLFEWYTQVSGALPSGQVAINFTGNIYRLTISWEDKTIYWDGNRDADADDDGAADRTSFEMSFEI